MPRDAQVQRAIAVWRLEKRGPFAHTRFYTPETFLDGHAAIGTLVPALTEPDFVEDHASSFAKRPGRARLPPLSLPEVETLRRIGAPEGPSAEVAVLLLRRARRTFNECEAADAVLRAPGPVPAPVRIEAAYLFAANGERALALDVLLERKPAPPWSPQPAPLDEGDAVDRGLQAAQLLLKHRAKLPVGAYVARPPPVATEAPSSTPVSELEVESLAWIGRPTGPSAFAIMALLRDTRGTAQGIRALRHVLAARESAPLPEAVRELCAELLVEQGDHALARAVLADAPPPAPPPPVPPGIDVDAPLRESEAAARAAGAERVLAGDLERLGVGERHARFQAVARAARLTVDAFRALGGRDKLGHDGGSRPPNPGSLRDAARRLEDAGEPGRAAEVYALGGDRGEASRLGVPEKTPPPEEAEAKATLEALDALDRRGLRLAAVEAARAFLAEQPDVEVAAFARGVLARLVTGPVVTFAIDGHERRVALGDCVTIGRVGATLTVPSPLVSRLHLRLQRRHGVPVVEDPGSHNGTWLAGARLTAPLPVGEGLQLAIGREIPLSIHLETGALALDLAGERTLVPLGALVVGGLRIGLSPCGDGSVVTLQAEPDVSATLADAPLDTAIELARGDVVRTGGANPFELRVIG